MSEAWAAAVGTLLPVQCQRRACAILSLRKGGVLGDDAVLDGHSAGPLTRKRSLASESLNIEHPSLCIQLGHHCQQ